MMQRFTFTIVTRDGVRYEGNTSEGNTLTEAAEKIKKHWDGAVSDPGDKAAQIIHELNGSVAFMEAED